VFVIDALSSSAFLFPPSQIGGLDFASAVQESEEEAEPLAHPLLEVGMSGGSELDDCVVYNSATFFKRSMAAVPYLEEKVRLTCQAIGVRIVHLCQEKSAGRKGFTLLSS
jgi:hypothetical protein